MATNKPSRFAQTIREAAELAGCSYGAAKKHITRGTIPRTPEGINADELASLVNLGRVAKTGVAKYGRGGELKGPDADRLLKAKADEKEEHARLAQIKREEQEGRLIPFEDVKAAGNRILGAVKGRLIGLGSSLAPRCAGRTADEIKLEVDGEVDDILRELAGMGSISVARHGGDDEDE